MSRFRAGFVAAALLMLVPNGAWAQASIAGVVKDASGGVLPGVTVEASSPSLIEKVRVVVTDGAGQYKIVDIRPGTYVVSFSLVGFTSIKREGIEVVGTSTATVNADLPTGEVRETVTVKSESPVVDTHSATQQQVLDNAVLNAIPLGRSYNDVAIVVPGLTTAGMDVGGTNNLQNSQGFAIHGSRMGDMRLTIDGRQTRNLANTGQNTNYVPDFGSTQEITIDYAAGSGEMATGGVRMNLIPREGGNAFSGSIFGTGVGPAFQASNLTQELKNQGLTSINGLKLQYDINPSMGGPIVPDKLWFFASARWQTNQNYIAGLYENVNAGNPASYAYAPNLSNQAVGLLNNDNANVRVTWQANPKNKFSFFFDNQWRTWNFLSPNISPESGDYYKFTPNWLGSAKWTAPLTNRLLLDLSYSHHAEVFVDTPPSESAALTSVVEQSSGLLYRGSCLQGPFFNPSNIPCGALASPHIQELNGSLSYVTGAHALKFGFSDLFGRLDFSSQSVGAANISYTFNKGVPTAITEYATPYNLIDDLNDFGLFAQDSWTVKRLTVQAGLRFDYYASSFPEYHLGPSTLLPNRNITFPATQGYNYKDINPRVGVTYDLFGDNKTALKVSAGRYGLGLNGAVGNPVGNQANQVTRSWTPSLPTTSANYYIPQCVLSNPMANGDCGTISDLTFGGTKPSTVIDPATQRGWGSRPYNWEFSTSVQRELTSRVSASVGYFRRWYGNVTVVDNTAVAPSDFSPYNITAPIDPRLPGEGGYVVGGLYNINPDKVGHVANYQTFANNYGTQIEHWNGFDFTVNARPRGGILLQGGVSTGRTTTDDCSIVDTYLNKVTVTTPLGSVQSIDMCHLQTPFLTQVKLIGTYPVPKIGMQVSATYQSLPGPQITANYTATNAQVQPSLGRPLSGGASNVVINIVEPGSMYGEQANELDLRFSKLFKFGNTRTSVDLDLYNVSNSSPVLTLNNSYGAWQTPLSVLGARLFRIGVRLEF